MNKYTLAEFKKAYPNDDACLDKLFNLRFTGLICPTCDDSKEFVLTKGRRSYNCTCCGFQVYPTKGTIFDKTTTQLVYWFHAIYLQTTTRNGVSAKELERNFDICYKTALRVAHQIKISMANTNIIPLTGIIEADETFMGRKAEFMHTDKRDRLVKNGNGLTHLIPVLVIFQRDGEVRTTIINEVNKKTLYPTLEKNISKEAIFLTDGLGAYTDILKLAERLNNMNQYQMIMVKTCVVIGIQIQLKASLAN